MSERNIGEASYTKEANFPLDLETRFEAVFAAIGNSEVKQITLLLLDRSPITLHDLNKRFREITDNVWQSDRNIQAGYCRDSLIPIGLVAEENFISLGSQDSAAGFKLTEPGEKYGKPIAAFLLYKSIDYPHSLFTIFGNTSASSGKTRSVTTRAAILDYLNQHSSVPSRQADIADHLGISGVGIGEHLKHLHNLGLVEYESTTHEKKGQIRYILASEAERKMVSRSRREVTLTQTVADLIFELGEVNSQIIFEKVQHKFPNSTERRLRSRISGILAGLVKQRICTREKFEGRKTQSIAKITKDGKDIVEDIIIPVKRALSDDEYLLDEWRQIPWQNYARQATMKYKEASGYANSQSHEERVETALAVIQSNPGIRPKELKTMLNYAPVNLLRSLLLTRRVTRVKTGNVTRYYAVETINPD